MNGTGWISDTETIEDRIAELETELGNTLYPKKRSDYPDASKYLEMLLWVKSDKDANSTTWNKLCRWH